MNNIRLSNAKKIKKDEFYTLYADIEKELSQYTNHLINKIIYLNCDDYLTSNFWLYLIDHFTDLKLKKIIASHINYNYIVEYDGTDKIKKINIDENGDFRCKRCVEVLKNVDIIITNPPFSLFRSFFNLLVEHGKKFIIWGNTNAISYKDVFPLLKENKVWLGGIVNKCCTFRLSDNYQLYDKELTRSINDGNKYCKMPSVTVYTNLELQRTNKFLKTYKYYDENKYHKYDNYDALNIDRVSDIPMDYDGVIGVPITFLGKHNPKQFQILGLAGGNTRFNGFNYSVPYTPLSNDRGGCGVVNGKRVFSRLLIKKII